MADSIGSTGGFKTSPLRQKEQPPQRREMEKGRPEAKDRVSLNQTPAAESTYAPQSPLNIGSQYELLRSLVIKTLQEQNVPLQISTGSAEIDFNTMTVEEAQALIAEDGYFGVEKTSDRIVDFAINAFGNDPSRLDEMIDAIDQGFREAQEAFGGMLPEISQRTYDAIMQKLDSFAQQSAQAEE